jgi:hypothetical protein
MESPSSPKVFNLSDADESGPEMFTPRKARPMSMPVMPRSMNRDYQLTLAEPKPIAVFELPATRKSPEVPIITSEVVTKDPFWESKPGEPSFEPLHIPKGPGRREKSRDISVPIKKQHPITPAAAASEPRSRTPSSSKTVKGPLNGVVAFVDVRTADGDDAGSPFAEALKNLGARVVKQWSWNGEEPDKIGITHVIFKQGGPRTISKIKMAKGAVKCVGLGWISRYAHKLLL